MIKYIQCVRRKSELSVAEFREQWEKYQDVVRELAAQLGAANIAFNTALVVEPNVRIMLQRGTMEPFDGTVEVSFGNVVGLESILNDPKIKLRVDAFRRAQEELMDMGNSCFFFAAGD